MVEQLEQAVSGEYNDWHPFLHTFLFYTVPWKLFHSVEMILFLQTLWFSAALSYLVMTMRKNGAARWLCAVQAGYVILNPCTESILSWAWKDCGLAIFSMVFTAHYINIICTKGAWLEKKRNAAAAGLFAVLAMLVRHNAVLLIAPMLLVLAVCIWKRKKQLAALAVCFAVAFAGIKGGLYTAFSVEAPGQRVTETVGMCLTIMGNAVVKTPDSLDPEVREFLYRVAPRETWETCYYLGSFNHVKWMGETDLEVIEEAGVVTVLKYTLQTVLDSPGSSLQALLRVTGMVWKIDGVQTWEMVAGSDLEMTDITLPAGLQQYCASLVSSWGNFVDNTVLNRIFRYIGILNMLLIAMALTGLRRKEDIPRALHVLPVLCYNFGTALLLTGYDWRFFYYTLTLFFPFMFLLCREQTEAESGAKCLTQGNTCRQNMKREEVTDQGNHLIKESMQ